MNVRKACATQGKFRFALNQPALLFADASAPKVQEPVPLTAQHVRQGDPVFHFEFETSMPVQDIRSATTTLGDKYSYDEGAQTASRALQGTRKSGWAWWRCAARSFLEKRQELNSGFRPNFTQGDQYADKYEKPRSDDGSRRAADRHIPV